MGFLNLKERRDRRGVQSRVDSVGYWFHSIDVGQDVVTPGQKPTEILEAEWQQMHLPDLHGKSVLDIGAWDGFFSFRSEAAGAARVVALDHYAWSLDIRLWNMTHDERLKMYLDNGFDPTIPVLAHDIPGIWQPETLPGKAGFDVAHELLDSNVEQHVGRTSRRWTSTSSAPSTSSSTSACSTTSRIRSSPCAACARSPRSSPSSRPRA